ncbi:MaoC/PaaZ C-terminal domain-containing protein [Nocardia xishanensis]
MALSQREVDVFAALTESADPIHNSPEWAVETQAFGPSTIVHGLFVACFIPRWLKEVPHGLYPTTDSHYSLNYGIDRLRWLKPIPVGIEFYATITAIDREEKTPGRQKVSFGIEVFQRGDDTPSMVAISHLMHVDVSAERDHEDRSQVTVPSPRTDADQ